MTVPIEELPPITKEQRRREREAGRLESQAGRMDPETRFRALLAILKLETEFLDLADKKARFALVIMSALNAVAIVVVVRGASEFAAPGVWGVALSTELGLYGAATLYYIWQAIQSLRPRGTLERPRHDLPTAIAPGVSMRMVFHADISQRDRDEYRALWEHLRLDNLTTELSDQIHMVSRINVAKYQALSKLYVGVGVMTGLLTLLLLTAAAARALS